MPDNLWRRIFAWVKADKNRSLKILLCVIVCVGGVILLGIDYRASRVYPIKEIKRNTYGEGDKKEELDVYSEEEGRQHINIEVSERVYSNDELESFFHRVTKRLDEMILGKNKSVDHIDQDMNLVTSIPDMPIQISWELSRYDVLGVDGKIQKDYAEEQGCLVELRGILTYTEQPEKQAVYETNVLVFPKGSLEEKTTISAVVEEIGRRDKETLTSPEVKLPEKYNGRNLKFYPKFEKRGMVCIVMAVICIALVFLEEKENEVKNAKKRKEELQIDYPEIVNKLTLFLGAGMTVKRAWQKIVFDYDREKEIRGKRYAYEEMRITKNEMESGGLESECYEKFGQRCQVQEYIRLGALLSQNLRKGTRGLNQLLHAEAIQSFEERKARAKRLGEEAGTKLLVPMFFMLSVVLVIVIVPAFLSIQM